MSFNEKLSYTEHVVTTPTTDFPFGFKFIEGVDAVRVLVNDVDALEAGYAIRLKNSVTMELQPAVESGVVRIYRETNIDDSMYRFTAGAKFVASNMDANFNQILHSQQEVRDQFIKLRADTFITLENFQEENFQELKEYVDGVFGMANPNLFDGITDNMVITQSGDSQRVLNGEVNTRLGNLESDVSNKASIQYVDGGLAGKASVATAEHLQSTKADTTYVDSRLNSISGGYAGSFLTYAAMQAASSTLPTNSATEVTNDPQAELNGRYTWNGTTFTKSNYDLQTVAAAYTDSKVGGLRAEVFSLPSKNLFDKSKAVAGSYFSPSLNKITGSPAYRRSAFIPVVAGTQYVVSGVQPSQRTIAWFTTDDVNATAISTSTIGTGVAPATARFAVFNITGSGQDDLTYDGTAQFEVGGTPTGYAPYTKLIDPKKVAGLGDVVETALRRDDVIEEYSFNRIDPTACDYVMRYSTGSKSFVADNLGIAASAYIPVVENEWYTLSGAYFGGSAPQGGYFTSKGAASAIANIEWVSPVNNVGKAFKVPTGLGITHVVVSLRKLNDNPASTSLAGDVQLELGEMATPYQPYRGVDRIREDLLPVQNNGGGGSAKFDDAAWFKYIHADSQTLYPEKLPNFRKAMLLKDKDVCVVMTGTSLTARTTEHSSVHPKANTRPPMMHSNAFCSNIWDGLMWEGQQYRRYDSNYFTEVGAFSTASNLPEWDDGAYRDGVTRYSTASGASVKFSIPESAWQFNFIYRTDSLGCNAKITVQEGVGQVQVLDAVTNTWVEANGYIFSMREAVPVTRQVGVPDPVTGVTTNTTLASKGNTTYQKRLKMRCRSEAFDSRTTAKSVTISNNDGSGRFMYWGVEWSPREYMITYINSSRGSHNTNAAGASGLPRFQDNEVWGFKPDLILSELAIHNDGAAGAGVYGVGRWAGLTYNYVDNLDYELSLYSRAKHFELNPEYAFFMGTITWNFGGIADDGTLLLSMQAASVKGRGKVMSALDKYQEAIEYLKSKDIPSIDTAKHWVLAGTSIFGDMKSATVGSGKTGVTFTNEGSHWNDTGGMVMAKAVLPILK